MVTLCAVTLLAACGGDPSEHSRPRAESETPSTQPDSGLTTPSTDTGQWPIPERVPRLVVDVMDPDRSEVAGRQLYAGYTNFLSVHNAPEASVAIHDTTSGTAIWGEALPDGEITVSPFVHDGAWWYDRYGLTADGSLTHHLQRTGPGIERAEWPLDDAHHAARPLTDGQFAWLAHDLREWRASWVLTDRLRVAELGSPSAVRFSLFDHLGGTLVPRCSHHTTPGPYDGKWPVFQWSHSNSLVVLGSRTLVYVRWLDTLLALEADGSVAWELGGPDSDFTWDDGSPLWTSAEDPGPTSHAHLSHAWDGGAVFFDNGDHRSPRVSSVVELAWDEAAGTVSEVWRYEHPEGRYLSVLGDVRKLERNYLIAWTGDGVLSEVTPEGEEVWRATTDPPLQVSRFVLLDP